MTLGTPAPKEGDLFMKINVHGHEFELRYGFYDENDREFGEPIALYPDLIASPRYTQDGRPLVTAVQMPCEHYTVAEDRFAEECCSDCIYYENCRDEISVCTHKEKQKL